MANTKSAKKRAIQNESRRKRNMSLRSIYRTYIKKLEIAINTNINDNILKAFTRLSSVLDKVASKGIIHKNKAARYKNRLNNKIRNICIIK